MVCLPGCCHTPGTKHSPACRFAHGDVAMGRVVREGVRGCWAQGRGQMGTESLGEWGLESGWRVLSSWLQGLGAAS